MSDQQLKYWQAINQALYEEMRRDANVCLFGEDVAMAGGPFSATQGLLDEFGPLRVRDTPISEQAMVGAAVGAAMTGLRVVVEVMFMNFMTLAMDQIVNQAAKAEYLWNRKIPLVVRTVTAAEMQTGPHHADVFDAWFAHVPGLKVVMPSTPADAKGLLKSAIREGSPVIVVESLKFWSARGLVPTDSDYLVPIGKAQYLREGKDLTLVAIGPAVSHAVEAANQLADKGIFADVIDLRTAAPLDEDAVVASVRRTHRIAIIQDSNPHWGLGAEVAACVSRTCLDDLDDPVLRIGTEDTPPPFSPSLEQRYYPRVDRILATLDEAWELLS